MKTEDINYIEQMDPNTFKIVYKGSVLVDFISRKVLNEMDRENLIIKWRL